MESTRFNKPLLVESNMFTDYLEKIKKNKNRKEHIVEHQKADIYSQNFFINEELNRLISELDIFTENIEQNELNEIINETEE
jgi:primosomal protein N''